MASPFVVSVSGIAAAIFIYQSVHYGRSLNENSGGCQAPGVLCIEAGSTPLDAARTTLRAIRDREEITPSRNRSYASNFVCAVA